MPKKVTFFMELLEKNSVFTHFYNDQCTYYSQHVYTNFSYEQQYLAEYLVLVFLTVSRPISKFFIFINDLIY